MDKLIYATPEQSSLITSRMAQVLSEQMKRIFTDTNLTVGTVVLITMPVMATNPQGKQQLAERTATMVLGIKPTAIGPIIDEGKLHSALAPVKQVHSDAIVKHGLQKLLYTLADSQQELLQEADTFRIMAALGRPITDEDCEQYIVTEQENR